MTAVARLLLENAPLNETVALQRCARLLAGELAAWVIVDVARGQRLRRQCVMGGEDKPAAELARAVAAQVANPAEPGPAESARAERACALPSKRSRRARA